MTTPGRQSIPDGRCVLPFHCNVFIPVIPTSDGFLVGMSSGKINAFGRVSYNFVWFVPLRNVKRYSTSS